MKKTNSREEKCRALELMLKGLTSAVLELEGNVYSEREINRIKKYLKGMKYSVFDTNQDKRGHIYHLHIIKYPNLKND